MHYPVLYLLDGDAHFHSVSGLIQILGTGINGTTVLPEMIVVAIPNTDRTRDLTPSHTTLQMGVEKSWLATSGGGDNFLKFMKNELIPHIDSAYRTAPYRVFVGHSFGGIAVIEALYTIPQTFNAYVSIEPSLWWDQQLLLKKAKTYFYNTDLTGKSLFIAQANTVQVGDTSLNQHFESIKEFATLLTTRNQSGIDWRYKYYEDDSHGSVPLIAEYDALRFIFRDFDVPRNIKTPEELSKHFEMLTARTNVTFRPPENTINRFGYTAMAGNNLDLAIRYFQMNIDLYPGSSNVYDSMGEAWMNKGDYKKAIDYYERSIKINSANENARQQIEKMKASQKSGH